MSLRGGQGPQLRGIWTPLALAAVSLLAALALWVAVTDAENPSREDVFRAAIEVRAVNVPEGQAVASIRDPNGGGPNVTIRIRAPEDSFNELTPSDFRAEVDMAGVRQATSEQSVIVRVVSASDVEIISVTPSIMTVSMEPVLTRLVPVQAVYAGAPPQGFSLRESEGEVTPTQARISGPESLVRQVSVAAADVNLTGLRAAIRQQYPLVSRDARGGDITNVRVEPSTAEVKVPIIQQEVTLTLTVLTFTQGSVADGFNLLGVTPEPAAVSVSGPLELLNSVPGVATEPIDVSGLRADSTRTVRLRLPAGLQAGRDSVVVHLTVAPAAGEIAIAVPPQVINTDGLRVTTLQASTIVLRLSGPLPVLSTLQPGAVRANLNVSGLGEGVHVVRVTPVLPSSDIQVVSIDPPQVVVGLSR